MFNMLKQGVNYAAMWQEIRHIKKLQIIFPEPRIIKATKFSQQLLMPLLLLTLAWQYFVIGYHIASFASTILTIIFIISLPLQGFYWLGKRSLTPLNEGTLAWYFKIYQKLSLQKALPAMETQPTFNDLVRLLQLADKTLDQDFWEEI